MGAPSTSILMHELFKLLHYAEAKNVKFLRMGTCGGLGVKPGTLILTKSGYDGCLEPGIEFIALGQKVINKFFVFSVFIPRFRSDTLLTLTQHFCPNSSLP